MQSYSGAMLAAGVGMAIAGVGAAALVATGAGSVSHASGHGIPEVAPETGLAAELVLRRVSRRDQSFPCELTDEMGLEFSADGCGELPFEELMQRPDVVLLAVAPFRRQLLFVSLECRAEEVWRAPFLDAAIRRRAGRAAYIASYATVEAYLSAAMVDMGGHEGLLFVWNTGACGAVLLHEALLACGAASLCGPHWFDQLCWLKDGIPESDLRLLVKLCHSLDWHMAKRHAFPGASVLALAPRGFGHAVFELVADAFPSARHAFVHADALAVTEALGAAVTKRMPWHAAAMMRWGVELPRLGWPPLSVPTAEAVMDAASEGPKKNALAKTLATIWADAMVFWKMVLEGKLGRLEAKDLLTLAAKDFANENVNIRRRVMAKVLEWVFGAQVKDADLEAAMKVFVRRPKDGDELWIGLSGSEGRAKFLTAEDETEIRAMVKQIPELGTAEYSFEQSIVA